MERMAKFANISPALVSASMEKTVSLCMQEEKLRVHYQVSRGLHYVLFRKNSRSSYLLDVFLMSYFLLQTVFSKSLSGAMVFIQPIKNVFSAMATDA